ncbi:synapse-associated protein 47kD isoform X2 [Lycorma delicatula]|uniref:synapse-associated protein 47kD isoform X2 n=1 Tax=Lycorma delicatula TaxID=130591 RepID=UPI003F515488
MFTGLTNQMSSWIGSTGKKQDGDLQSNESEQQPVSSPVVEDNVASSDTENKKDISPTKGGSRLDVLGNLGSVKTQMTSWLGRGSSAIPGLSNNTTTALPPDAAAENPAPENRKESPVDKADEDDNSSATGGADSEGHVSEEGTPVEDKDGQQAFGAVTTKALQGAKSIGGFFFSAVNKAGKTVTEASAKIKKTVEENSLLGEFNKEQEQFIKNKQGKAGEAAVPPWVGYPNEDALKEECLSLSSDRRNFVRSPPAGVDFQFDYEVSYPIAMATLAEDPNLEKMRFELVPKVINEENFWRNYFYRVSLICQASELNSMAQEGDARTTSIEASGDNAVTQASVQNKENLNAAASRSSTEATGTSHSESTSNKTSGTSNIISNDIVNSSVTNISNGKVPDSPLHEFISDTFTASKQDLLEVEQNMKKLGITDDAQSRSAKNGSNTAQID